MKAVFDRFARHASWAVGTPHAFVLCISLILVWAVSGPFMEFSQTWQLIANTTTTLATTLLVLIVQNTQTRDTAQIIAMLKEISEDLPDVDDQRARDRVVEEEKP